MAHTGQRYISPEIAQEMALIAVKADVTEELDRLRAHVAAARDLLAAGSPVIGRYAQPGRNFGVNATLKF